MKNEIYQKALLHIDEYRCAKFACSAFIICKKRTATHPLFAKSIYFLSLEISRQNLLPRKDLLIILQVSLQQLRCIQSIRAFAHAVAAVETVFDLHHLRLDFRCELEVGRGSSEEKRHSRTGVDLDAGRAWHAVAAGTAEAAEQLLSVILDQGADLVIHHRRIVDVA